MYVALAKHWVNYTIIQWIRAVLEGQLATVTLGEFSRIVEVSIGCPQGGVLSPLLWCLVDELISRLNRGGVYTQGYTDDIWLLSVGTFPNTVSELIQWALHTVEMWCDKLGFSVYPDKNGLVTPMRRRKVPRFFEPCLSGKI
jgi:hypothetical protein